MGLSLGTLFPLRLRLWFGRLIFRRELGPSTVRVSWRRIIKGPCDPPEIEAMEYVTTHTSISVPRIHKIHTPADGSIYIEMEYVRGEPLRRAWHHMSAAQRDAVFADIQVHVASLRALTAPARQTPEDIPLLGDELVRVHTATRYETRFAHADLSPYNILVRDARVVAVIDWAFAGWYPEYWEYTKAHYNYFPGHDWAAYLDRALPNYKTELAAERVLWARLPEPGTSRTTVRDGVSRTGPGSSPAAAWLAARAGRETQDLWSRCLSWRGISSP